NTLIASIGGRIYRINVSSDFSAHYIGIPGDDNPAVLDHVWMEQAGGRWLVIQDGQSRALIWNGSLLRRSNPTVPEVPVGERMAYGMGRLWISKGNEFVGGDLYGTPSPTATSSLGYADAVLKFTENTYLNGGGAFTVPMESG